jgi:hypothetical protein
LSPRKIAATIAAALAVAILAVPFVVYFFRARARPEPMTEPGRTAADLVPLEVIDELRILAPALAIEQSGHDIPMPPALLVGREAVLVEAEAALADGRRVLLYGFGGNGKTALASVIAHRALAAAANVVWLSMEDATVESAFDLLIEKLGSTAGADRRAAVREAISTAQTAGPILVVLDDVGDDGAALLNAVLEAVPVDLPVLITSRRHFSTAALGLNEAIPVDGLAAEDALRLLSSHARQLLPAEASALCTELDNHALQIVLAGELLRRRALSVDALRAELAIAPERLDRAHDLGPRDLWTLLDRSVAALGDPARKVVEAFGEFTGRGATAELVAAYINADDSTIDARAELEELVDRSLATRFGASTYYAIHSLTHRYATRKRGSTDHLRAIRAVSAFVSEHEQDDALLALDLRNIIGAAEWARAVHPDALVSVMGRLAAGYVNVRGYSQLIDTVDANKCLFSAAIRAAGEKPGWRDQRHDLLSKRGNARVEHGNLAGAIEDYTAAYELAPTPERTVVLLSVIGNIESERPDDRRAQGEAAYAQAYAVAELTGERWALVRVLGLHSNTAFNVLKDYELTRVLAGRAVAIARDLKKLVKAIPVLITLGSAEFERAIMASIKVNTARRASCQAIGDAAGQARATAALGLDHHARNDFNAARTALEEAMRSFEACGDHVWAQRVRVAMEQFGYRARGPDTPPEGARLADLRSTEFSDGVAISLRVHNEALALAEGLSEENRGAAIEDLAAAHHAVALDLHALEDMRSARPHLIAARELYMEIGRDPSAQEIREFMRTFGY